MSNVLPNITPGDVVPGGFTYPNNAQLVGDFLYLRDADGNGVGGHQVDAGDKITVLDIGFAKQLALVQYPAGNVVRQGYINNNTNIIKYFNQGKWNNGSTSETVYNENDVAIGSIDPHEAATPLYKAGGKIHVVYNTSKGANTKSGYVAYDGGFSGFGGSSGSSGLENGIAPGDVVPGGFTYPNNAQLVGDFLYLRDANGNGVGGHQVDTGDKVTVLDVGYTKQLVLLQYPAGNVVRQGYVNNDTKIIKYFNQGQWHNGSTSETVYDENNVAIGSLDPHESATPIYKRNGMTHVVYNTDKGANTKSGFVKYEGGSSSSSGLENGVAPGDVVPGGFTYPNNAQLVGDFLYLRDANGNGVGGHQVDTGDKVTVLDVGYTKQLVLLQYPAGNVVRQGYVNNDTKIIKYFNEGQWHNGSTSETVYDENNVAIGSLDPYESATPIYKRNGMTHVVYNTDKGANTKSGFVKYEGGSAQVIDIPYVTVAGADKIQYGTSGKGRPLIAHKIGSGSNSLVMVCEVHGFEDHWSKDGIELVNIGNDLIKNLVSSGTNGWSVYVIPSANPDGLAEGYTKDGPGRCTIVGQIDINRDFPVGFTHNTSSRNYTDSAPLTVPESKQLSDFLQGVKNSTPGQMVVIDLHGWEGAAIGNPEIGQYFRNQFGFEQRNGYGEDQGYLIAWTNSVLGAKSALIELPTATYSHSDVVNGNYSQKITNAVNAILANNPGTKVAGKTYSDAMDCISTILYNMGYQNKLDANIPFKFIVGNFEVDVTIGSTSTMTLSDGKVGNISIKNGKPSFDLSDFPITEYIKLQSKLDELALKIGNGNISIALSSKQKITIEIKFDLDALVYLSKNLYCKIEISIHEDYPSEEISNMEKASQYCNSASVDLNIDWKHLTQGFLVALGVSGLVFLKLGGTVNKTIDSFIKKMLELFGAIAG
ncbi:M14 family zinc carboxypeptidase [Inconstantimicrobium mannanitabidum]|uniref:Uncharacterized protein n=1 Tax=Inconstantimicrobium mannanitabidum TaxID=1604901 RepID=A0ACB5RIN7_9CLOT|nr:M14 family zinc carboxypeptidase [Clostridium sp. TW13]GKX68960.1 hypothetical protein rsdtw13_42180 [Clostridium sp. TW13]